MTFEKSVVSKVELGPRLEPLDARLRPVHELEEEALGRPRVVMSELAAVRACDVLARARRSHESPEPAVVVRDRVLRGEDDHLAARELDAQVPRAAVAELLRCDLVHDRAVFTRLLGAAVGGARVHDNHLDLLLDLLGGDAGEATREIGTAVLDGNDDRDHAGVAARTNW